MSKIGKRKPYKTYTKEFKLEALKLMETSDKPTSEVAMQLGIRRNQLYKWKAQMEKKGEVSSGQRGRPKKEDQSEVSRLRQELKRVKEENDILKKAAVFFAKELD
ncbi:MAG: transposase [Gammaproteobacteria bacterium]|nr:transposase [Gammaproteobacteria bacterium]